MKFSQLIGCSQINRAVNEAGRLVLDLFLFVKKTLSQVTASGLQLVSIYFDSFELDIQ